MTDRNSHHRGGTRLLELVRGVRTYLWLHPYVGAAAFLGVLGMVAVFAPTGEHVPASQRMAAAARARLNAEQLRLHSTVVEQADRTFEEGKAAVAAGKLSIADDQFRNAKALYEQPNSGRPKFDGPTRSLQFPTETAIGVVKYRASQEEEWRDLAVAQGIVEVPTEYSIWLGLYGVSTAAHVELLAQFPTDAFHTLSLAGVPIPSDAIAKIASLRGLRDLNLNTTYTDDEALQALSVLPDLEALNISRTLITDDGLQHLASFQSLERLVIEETQVSGELIQQFIESHPRVEVSQTP